VRFFKLNAFLFSMVCIQFAVMGWFILYSEPLTTRSAALMCFLSISISTSILISVMVFIVTKMEFAA